MDIMEILSQTFDSQKDAVLKEAEDKLKTAATTMTANKLHGTNGLFSTPGIDRDVVTSMVRPFGIGSVLDIYPSVTEDPRFPVLTGVTNTVGTEPTKACDDAPTAFLKGANLTAKFGMFRRDTNTIDIAKTMLQVNRGDMRDLMLRGKLLGMNGMAPSEIDDANVLDILTKSEMVIAAVNCERKLGVDLWQGTVASGSFPGLDQQIATGQKDADSGVLVPSLDSDIKSFAYDRIGGSGRDIVEYVSAMAWYLKFNAMSMGLDPVKWVIVMRPDLWQELTAIWPLVYNTTRNTVPSGNYVVVDGRANVQDRDAMRRSMSLTINGEDYPVVVDTGIFEHNNINNANLKPGEYASSIYFVPLTIQGNFPVCYREYLDFRAADRDTALLKGNELFWTDNGVYSWAIEQIKWCYKLALRTEQRVVLRTPHLAGKIQHVKYVPLQHLRQPNPSDPYHLNGGVSLRGYTPPTTIWS